MTSPYLDLPLRTLEQAQLDRALTQDAKTKAAGRVGENKPPAAREVNRFNTVTQRVDTIYGALYLHAAYSPGGELAGARVSIPGTMHGKELGKVLEDVFAVLNSMLAS